jgi:folate-dependent phosphoribosylglycinamide formyltransferase PurN/L-amino acid N-acyltransferase YncA
MLVRDATLLDSAEILEWRNNKNSRIMFFDSSIIAKKNHDSWFSNALKNQFSKMFIGEYENIKIGICRFDVIEDSNKAKVSINMNPECRGKGLAKNFLQKSIDKFWTEFDTDLEARVKHINIASLRIFQNVGFYEIGRSDTEVLFMKAKPKKSSSFSKKILFLGYDNSQTTLIEFLEKNQHYVQKSSKSPIEIFSEREKDYLQNFDLIISFGYRYIIPKDMIDQSPLMINLHISMLPYNRGSHPDFWSHYDSTPSGVTIHVIDEGIDTGDYLYQKPVTIDPQNYTFREAHQILLNEIEGLFISNSDDILSGNFQLRKYTNSGTYHNSCDLPANFLGWDQNIANEINRLKSTS